MLDLVGNPEEDQFSGVAAQKTMRVMWIQQKTLGDLKKK